MPGAGECQRYAFARSKFRLLVEQPSLQYARRGGVGGEVFADEFVVEFAALGGGEFVAEGHLPAFDVGTDEDAVHGPVERAEPFALMTGGAGHGVRDRRVGEVRAEALRAVRRARRAETGAERARVEIFIKAGRAVTEEALIDERHDGLLGETDAAGGGKDGQDAALVTAHAVVVAVA